MHLKTWAKIIPASTRHWIFTASMNSTLFHPPSPAFSLYFPNKLTFSFSIILFATQKCKKLHEHNAFCEGRECKIEEQKRENRKWKRKIWMKAVQCWRACKDILIIRECSLCIPLKIHCVLLKVKLPACLLACSPLFSFHTLCNVARLSFNLWKLKLQLKSYWNAEETPLTMIWCEHWRS